MEAFKSIIAPFDGVVTARSTDLGALINAGTRQELFRSLRPAQGPHLRAGAQAFSAALAPGLKANFEMRQLSALQLRGDQCYAKRIPSRLTS